MSQKIIVTCRRSAEAPGARADACRDVVGLVAGAVPGLILVPHSEQNLACGGLACPQAAQARGSAVPHSEQNLLPSGTFALQFSQCIIRVSVVVLSQRSLTSHS